LSRRLPIGTLVLAMDPRPTRLEARLLVDLGPVLAGWEDPVAFGIGWDGAVYAALRRCDEVLRLERGLFSFPKSTLEQPTDYLIVRWHEGETKTLVHRGESVVASFIQPVPEGVLLVGARCQWRPEGAERNAVVLDWTGRELRRLTVGDGIEDVRLTREGTIWVSYFDEGVFGNYGWSHPGPRAMGDTGLVAYSPIGEVAFAYDASRARTDSICDAYAMNLSADDDVWVYFYTQFPIVRIRQGAYRAWTVGVKGARALAVRGDRAILFDDYERRGASRVVHLPERGDAEVTGEVVIEGPSGESLRDALVRGVGERLFFFKDRRVWVLERW
jgi:hypothetical protein